MNPFVLRAATTIIQSGFAGSAKEAKDFLLSVGFNEDLISEPTDTKGEQWFKYTKPTDFRNRLHAQAGRRLGKMYTELGQGKTWVFEYEVPGKGKLVWYPTQKSVGLVDINNPDFRKVGG